MNLLISEEYRALQKELHSRGGYGISAPKWAKSLHQLAEQMDVRSVLDYGCGTSLLIKSLPMSWERKYEVNEYDPAIEGKESLPDPADIVFSGDVLEHIEPVCLEEVLDHIMKLAKKAVFLIIATRPATKILADGRNAHLIVEPSWWWMRRLNERWRTATFGGDAEQLQFTGLPR